MDIGIYIATANRPQLFRRALESLFAQIITPVEVQVVVNGSDEFFPEYKSVIKSADKGSIVSASFHPVKMSPGLAKNLALQRVSAEFATGLDDDDYFLPVRLLNFLEYYLDKNLDSSVLFSNSFVERNGSRNLVRRKAFVALEDLAQGNLVGNQVFGPCKILKSVGYNDLSFADDFDFAVRLAGRANVMFNTGEADYILDRTHALGRVSKARKDTICSTYELLGDFYSAKYGLGFSCFSQMRFAHEGIHPGWDDIFNPCFLRRGALLFSKRISRSALSSARRFFGI